MTHQIKIVSTEKDRDLNWKKKLEKHQLGEMPIGNSCYNLIFSFTSIQRCLHWYVKKGATVVLPIHQKNRDISLQSFISPYTK